MQGQTGSATISVIGALGVLQGWIDWNGDGDFADSGEQIATSVRDNQTGDTNPATGVITISFAIPLTAITTQTLARFRWSTQSGLPPANIIARDGEVEDYALTVAALVASVTPTKVSNVLSDPVNGSNNPKAIPGAIINYCIFVSNTGNATATNIVATDTIPTSTSYSASSMNSGANCASTSIVEDDDATDGGETDLVRASISGNNLTITAESLAPSSNFALTFRVTVN